MNHPAITEPAEDEEVLQLAARTAQRIITQCRSHAQTVVGKLSDRINSAPARRAARTSPQDAQDPTGSLFKSVSTSWNR
ncbi:hypothetical protein [Microbacterium sp. gxy059]|uniref:hypothetical protein n=1 Tax=Microbacterium sp. gxy059 TaxID=2957199 RepID=UPI003D97CE20